jgi:hypothetical protein
MRNVIRAGVVAAMGFVAVYLSAGVRVSADDEKLPSISEIMKKAHKKTDGYLDKLTAEAKGGKWDDAKDDAKSLLLAGEALGKNTPPKGEAKSWEKLTAKYVESAKGVSEAVEKKDSKAVTDSIGAIRKSCGACHSAHKGK